MSEDDLVVVDRDSRGGQVAAFLLGAAIGAGVALLFAPQPGARTRADLARRARRAQRKAMVLAGELKERAGGVYDTAREEIQRRAKTAREGVSEVIDEVKTRVEAGREAGAAGARAAREDMQRRLAEARSRDGGVA